MLRSLGTASPGELVAHCSPQGRPAFSIGAATPVLCERRLIRMIEAAGGVVWRTTFPLHHEVLIVHRPHREDWSLPKGRRHRRETALECALREVTEETGLGCTAEEELPEVRYTDRRGRARRVRYWAMQAVRGEFRPNDEVDEVRWTPLGRVDELLTYERDVVVVSGLRLVRGAVA
jgi:8-oxo-dGTP pyrophosphatase MutT (NUDIX family)